MLNTTLKTRLVMLSVVFILAFVLDTSAQTPRERAINLVKEGIVFYDRAEYQKAKEKYQSALAIDEEIWVTYYFLGLAQARLHEHKPAAISFMTYLTKVDDIPRISIAFQIGYQYRLANDFVNSDLFFDAALKSTPRYAADYDGLATIYNYRGNLTLAAQNKVYAINFKSDDNDDDVDRYIGLSWFYSFLLRHQDAVTAATRAIQLNSGAAMAYTNRCRAYNDLKLYDKAISDCQKALSLQPDHGETQYYLANSYRATKNPREAERLNKLAIVNLIGDFKQAADNHAVSLHDYCYILGNALLQNGQFAEAVTVYNKGLELRANFPLLRFNLGIAHLKLSNKGEALDQYRELLKIDSVIARNLKRQIDAAMPDRVSRRRTRR